MVPVSQPNSATPKPNSVSDQGTFAKDHPIYNAAVAGLANGPAFLAGTPSALVDLAAGATKLVDKPFEYMTKKMAGMVGGDAAEKYYTDLYKTSQPSGNPLPTAADARHALATGMEMADVPDRMNPFKYQPKDMAQRVAFATGGGATSNPWSPVSGMTGGFTGAAADETVGKIPYIGHPLAMLIGGLGAAAPGVAATQMKFTNPGNLMAEATEGVTPAQWEQAQQVQQAGRDLNVPLSGAESIQQATGQPNALGAMQRLVENTAGGGNLRAMVAERPAAVQAAGDRMIGETFGRTVAPEIATDAAATAAKGAVTEATNARTEAGRPYFEAAQSQKVPAVQGLDDLKREVDAALEKSGTLTTKGRALADFRKQLNQGVDSHIEALKVGLEAAGVKPGSPAWEQGMAQVAGGRTGEVSLGPLETTNREMARRLQQKYAPGVPAEQQTGFPSEVGAVLGPLNNKLTDLLAKHSSEYGTGLKIHGEMSPEVNRLYNGPVGRIADTDSGDVGARLTRQAGELIGENSRPAQVRQVVNDMVSGERTNREAVLVKEGLKKGSPEFKTAMAGFEAMAVPQVVGAHMENLFTKATEKLQTGPNPFGGAKFAKEVMGNRQQAQNLQALVESLPGGKGAWPGVQKFFTVMEATGKRRAAGSETQLNQMVKEGMTQPSGVMSGAAAVLSPPKALKFIGEKLDGYAYRLNAKEISRVLSNPESVKLIRQMAVWGPQTTRAKLLATQAIELANPGLSGQSNAQQGN